MDVRRVDTVTSFLALAGEFLGAREAEHNLILGISSGLTTNPEWFTEPTYFGVVVHGGRVVAAALRTPPRDLVLSETDEPAAVTALLDDLAGERLPGVSGPAGIAGVFAEGWSKRTSSPARLGMRMRIFRCASVIAARPAAGRARVADAGDRDVAARWIRAFQEEALAGEDPSDPEELAERWTAGGARTLYLWIDDDGSPVSMAGAGGRTPNGVRIGLVYTPPERRGRGYASNVTAAATQAQLDSGRAFAFLYTDLANPTSNHIYQEIGFEAVSDVDRYAFD
jgi:predicted GNAT family acetyltransferase